MTNTSEDKAWQSLAELTAKIIGDYLHNHHANVAVEALAPLVRDVKAALGPNGGAEPHATLAHPPTAKIIAPRPLSTSGARDDEAEKLIAEEAARVAATKDEREQDPWVEEVKSPTKIILPQEPAVPIDKAIQPDHIICLECGAHHKSMKGHLKSKHGLMPLEYREKWGLEKSYPMVAPNYSARRKEIGNQIALKMGRKLKASESK